MTVDSNAKAFNFRHQRMEWPDDASRMALPPARGAGYQHPSHRVGNKMDRHIIEPRAASAANLGFIEYRAGDSPSPFYTALVAARTDRGAAQNIALAFIDGQPPYNDMFVGNFGHLPAPIRDFPKIAALNRQPVGDAIAWRDTLLQTVRTLLADHSAADTYFTDPAYLADIDRLWQSYFALIIQLGFDQKLLADITLALWLAHILAVTLDPLGKPSALTPAQLSSLTNATIVLPSAIFPLAPAE